MVDDLYCFCGCCSAGCPLFLGVLFLSFNLVIKALN